MPLMSLQDALNIILIVVLVTFIICILITTYFSVKALKAVTNLAEDIKEKSKLKVLATIPTILLSLVSKFVRRGR